MSFASVVANCALGKHEASNQSIMDGPNTLPSLAARPARGFLAQSPSKPDSPIASKYLSSPVPMEGLEAKTARPAGFIPS